MKFRLLLSVTLLLVAATRSSGADLLKMGSTYSSTLVRAAIKDSFVICSTPSGIEVLRFRDSLPPEPIAQLNLYDQRGLVWWDYGVTDLKISGQTAYAVDCNGHLYSIDLSNPLDPTVIETVVLPRPATALDVSGTVACVAYGSYRDSTGILLLDLSTPTEIAEVGAIRFPDSLNPPEDVAVRDTVMFAICQGALLVFNIADPSAPVFLDSVRVNHNPFLEIELDRSDSLVYLSDRGFNWPTCQSGLTVVNAADPADLLVLSRTVTYGAASQMAVSDSLLFLTAGSWGLQVYDRANSAQPDSLTRLPITYFAGDVVANESLAVVTDYGPMYFLDLDIERFECKYWVDWWPMPWPPTELTVVGISAPIPQIKASYSLPSPATGIAVASNTIYCLYNDNFGPDVMAIDVTSPSKPTWIGSCLTGFGNSTGVVVDTFLYVASTGIGTISTPGIRTINIADPANPFVVAEETLAVGGINFQVRDTLLYVMRGGDGISLVNIATPDQPATVFTYDSPGIAKDVCFLDSMVYIADGDFGIIVLSMPSISNVQWVGQIGGSGNDYCRIMVRDSLLLALTPNSIEVYDIASDRVNPPFLGGASIGPNILDFGFESDRMYAAVGERGVLAYDIGNPADPQLVAEYDTPVNALAVEARDSMVFVADQENLVCLRFTGATSVDGNESGLPSLATLKQNYPNPFNPSTKIEYSLPRRAHVRLTVYNLLGQQVAKLVDAEQSAGTHNVVWQAHGQSSGFYLYRLQAGEASATKKMLLLK
ncbi:MAG: T9SS type A sorting domain-containing protein [bacterium]|nr:T9SS type A sorting domain-containing protein [bacterium]